VFSFVPRCQGRLLGVGDLDPRSHIFLSPALSRYIVPPMPSFTSRSLFQAFGIASINHLLPVLLH
jgi:hypothetical protein